MNLDDLKAELARISEENQALNDTIALTIKFAKSVVEQRDQEIKDLLADLECKDARIRNLHDEIASLGEVIKTKNAMLSELEPAV